MPGTKDPKNREMGLTVRGITRQQDRVELTHRLGGKARGRCAQSDRETTSDGVLDPLGIEERQEENRGQI